MNKEELIKDHERYIQTGKSLMYTSVKLLMSQYKQAASYISEFPEVDQDDYTEGFRICAFVQQQLRRSITESGYIYLHSQIELSAEKLGDYSKRLEKENIKLGRSALYQEADLQLVKMKAFTPDPNIPETVLSNWRAVRDELDTALFGVLFDSPTFRGHLMQTLEKAVSYHDYMVQLNLYLKEENK